MKTIIYYYTLTGHCQKLAQKVASKLGCEVEQIIESEKRVFKRGGLRFFNGGDAIKKKSSSIKELIHNPIEYNRIIIITPLWASSPTPAIRGFVKKYGDKLKEKRLGLLVTNQGSDPRAALEKYEKLFPEKLVAVSLTEAKKEWTDPKEGEIVDRFIKKL